VRRVNYYSRNLGDYAKRTTTLTQGQHGAYNLLLDYYYVTEQPIPEHDVYSVAKAVTKPERDAVDRVLERYFELVNGAWRHERCEEVIADYVAQEPKREAKRQNANTRAERYRARRAKLFEALRELGVVPPYDTTTQALDEMLSRHTSRVTSRSTSRVTSRVTPAPVTRDITTSSPTSTSTSNINPPSEQPTRDGMRDITRDANGAEPNGTGDGEIKKTTPKSPRNGDWNGILNRVEKALHIEPDPAHPDYATLAKLTALTESQCRSAVQQLTDRGRLPNGKAEGARDA
jgi:uncharacterized protein YdaU (DUF1376 family)